MFQGFLTALLGLIPFLKELILGNQTLRQAIMNNKFVVMLGLIFMLLFGAMLYMRDAATAANARAANYKSQLDAKVCPPQQAIVLADPQGIAKDKRSELKSPYPEPLSTPHTHHHHHPINNDDTIENEALDRLYQRSRH